jgi:hypothetical protein
MKRWYHGAARRDLREAALWYDEKRPGLGDEFLEAVQTALGDIETNPLRFPVVYKDLRRIRVLRFPYQVLFVSSRTDLDSIFAVIHPAREPEIWKRRR